MSSTNQEESFIVKYRKELLIGSIAVLMMLFIVWNSEPIDFSLVFFSIKISKIFLIALFFVMGMITMWIRYRSANQIRDKKMKELEEKVKQLEANQSTTTGA